MAVKKSKTVDSKVCGGCGSDKKLTEYYSSYTYVTRGTERTNICKKCVWDYVEPEEKNAYNLNKVKEILRMMDKPFIQNLWNTSAEESEKKEPALDYFKTYMKNVAMTGFRNLNWNDSEFEIIAKNEKDEKDELKEVTYTQNELKIMRKFWGDYNVSDYTFLEEFFNEYMSKFPKETPAQINIYKSLAKIHLQAEKELAAGQIKNYKDLMDLSSKMHNDGNIKPIQSSGVDEKTMSAYGLWIKDIEKTEPAEYFKNKPLYEDYDSFGKYLEKWFLRPIKNIFNVSNDFDVGDK
jgi:hypothetical protein